MNTLTFIKADIFRQAWNFFKQHAGLLILIHIITLGLNIFFLLAGRMTGLGFVHQVLRAILNIGYLYIMLGIIRNQPVGLADWVKHTTLRTLVVMIITGILYSLFSFIGTIFLIIPGIYLLIILSMYQYLIVDKNMGIFASLGQSIRITKGHRWNILLFGLCTLGWNLLGLLCLGVGLLVTVPFTALAGTLVYEHLNKAKSE